MDVTKILAELRSERDDIEQAILALERFDPHSAGAAKGAGQSVSEIRGFREPDDAF